MKGISPIQSIMEGEYVRIFLPFKDGILNELVDLIFGGRKMEFYRHKEYEVTCECTIDDFKFTLKEICWTDGSDFERFKHLTLTLLAESQEKADEFRKYITADSSRNSLHKSNVKLTFKKKDKEVIYIPSEVLN